MNKDVTKAIIALAVVAAMATVGFMALGSVLGDQARQETSPTKANVFVLSSRVPEIAPAPTSEDGAPAMAPARETGNVSSGDGLEPGTSPGEDHVKAAAPEYEPGQKASYSGWFSVAVPKGFAYSDDTGTFYNESTSDSMAFGIVRYSEFGASTFEDAVAIEKAVYDGMAPDGGVSYSTRVSDIAYGPQNWKALEVEVKDVESGETYPSLVELMHDAGNGEYAVVTLYASPDAAWVRDMMISFSLLPGDAFENWSNHYVIPGSEKGSFAFGDNPSASDIEKASNGLSGMERPADQIVGYVNANTQ